MVTRRTEPVDFINLVTRELLVLDDGRIEGDLTVVGTLTVSTAISILGTLTVNVGAAGTAAYIAQVSAVTRWQSTGDGTITWHDGAGVADTQLSRTAADTLTLAAGDSFAVADLTTGSIIFAAANGVLAQDNANLFWDDGNDRLGVGTDSPVSQIHVRIDNSSLSPRILVEQVSAVNGNASFQASVPTGSPGNPLVLFNIAGGTSWAIGVDNSDIDKFTIGHGTQLEDNPIISITPSNENVGIGTTVPSAKLHVSDDINVAIRLANTAAASTANTAQMNFVLQSTSTTRNSLVILTDLTDVTDATHTGRVRFQVPVNGSLTDALILGGTEVVINSGGGQDVRAEIGSNTNAIMLSNSLSSMGLGAAAQADTRVFMAFPTLVVTDNAQGESVDVAPALTEGGSGTHAIMAGVNIQALALTGGVAATTEAATLRVAAAPTGATDNWSLLVSAGDSMFRERVLIEINDGTAYSATAANGQRAILSTFYVSNQSTDANSVAQIVFEVSGASQSGFARIAAIRTGGNTAALAFTTENGGAANEGFRMEADGNIQFVTGTRISRLNGDLGIFASSNNDVIIGDAVELIRIDGGTNSLVITSGLIDGPAAAALNINAVAGQSVVFNSVNEAVDFFVHSDSGDNVLHIDGNEKNTLGAIGIGGAPEVAGATLTIHPGTTGDSNAADNGLVLASGAMSAVSGTHATKSMMAIDQITYNTAGATITDASSLRIIGPPIAGSATITNTFALHIDSGNSRFDGDILLEGAVVVKSNSTTEIGLQVTNGSLTVGSLGSLIVPVKTDTGAPNDAAFGNLDGAFGFNSFDNTLEVRDGVDTFLSVGVSGTVIQQRAAWREDHYYRHEMAFNLEGSDGISHRFVNETLCVVCGEKLDPIQDVGRAIAIWGNGFVRDGDLHGVYGHLHIEREPTFEDLQRRVEFLESELAALRT